MVTVLRAAAREAVMPTKWDSPAALATRTGLHAVAEQLLAGPQHRTSGTIRLTVTDTGFSTITTPRLRVHAGSLTAPDGQKLALDGATINGLAAALGLEPGAATGVYHDVTGWDPDASLGIDSAIAADLCAALADGAAALTAFAPDISAVLWPEHFDVGIAREGVNYGVSPGDGFSSAPYAYVGPHSMAGLEADDFFNAPFGAARSLLELDGVDGMIDFFRTGQEAATRS
jgi:hypothetical protein